MEQKNRLNKLRRLLGPQENTPHNVNVHFGRQILYAGIIQFRLTVRSGICCHLSLIHSSPRIPYAIANNILQMFPNRQGKN